MAHSKSALLISIAGILLILVIGLYIIMTITADHSLKCDDTECISTVTFVQASVATAIATYDQALKQNPKDAQAYYNRGIVYELIQTN